MSRDLATNDYVNQLYRAALRPTEKQVQKILQAEKAAVQPLLEVACEVQLFEKGDPKCYAPIHALRLLGELHPLEMIDPLLALIPINLEYPNEDLLYTWLLELPQFLGRIGHPALEPLWEVIDDQQRGIGPRTLALAALSYLAVIEPDTRASTIARMREHLEQATDKLFRTYLVQELSNLGVAELYSYVMSLYREGALDADFFPAKNARQLLLGPPGEGLAHVNLSLWERYDIYG
jgi:hypothetical protein